MSILKRITSFASLPLAAALIPLVALPVVARVGGQDGWTALNLGQSLGAYGAVIAFTGWNVLGIPLVATARTREARDELYAASFYIRLGAFVLILPLLFVATVILAPEGTRVAAFLYSIAAASLALSVGWFAVAVSDAKLIAVYELLPKALFTLASIPLVLVTGDVSWYACGLLASTAVGLSCFHWRHFGTLVPSRPTFVAVKGQLRQFRAAWGTEASGNLYANAPMPVASTLDVSSAATYASSDKLYRYALLALTAISNAFQGWVLESAGTRRKRRSDRVILVMILFGVFGGGALVILGPATSELLFGRDVRAASATMLWLGIAFVASCVSTPLIRNSLMPARMDRKVLSITILSAVAGLATMIVLLPSEGATGVAIGLALSEALTACVCATIYVSLRRDRHHSHWEDLDGAH